MYEVPGCTINDRIFESSNSLVYRGVRQADERPVIVKILKEDYPSPQELIRYRQEYEITRNLDLPGVIQAYGQVKYGNTLAIILEDFGGESLRIHGERQRFTVIEALRLINRVARILGALHQENVIHKDINPSNIIYNAESGELKIIDFGISSKLSRELPVLKNPEHLEGTLAYMSPEQTGRMNRPLDYRTDFYALGATFYELLTGRPPFTSLDPMELTHCHLAREPVPPGELNPEISENLSQVVLKLLAKTAEKRYQTARGLVGDLDYCLEELTTKKTGPAFTPGRADISTRFQLPQKLYGRELELKTLLTAAERSYQGKSEVLLVAGYSGVGKSALVKELYKTLIRPEARNGYFITGKFDQYHRDIPYSAAQDAFRDLIRQLLTENEVRLSYWESRIKQALGPNGQIMTEFLPELELIIGKQSPLPELEGDAISNRFKVVMRNFIDVFLQAQHPLVLFLDDLQWADLASLNLIKLMSTNTKHLLLIGAYRDNEVSSGHPLLLTVDEMQKADTPLNTISLPPLNLADIRRFIADATRRNTDDTKELADLIKHKTNGNPFFMGEFLESMIREDLLNFHEASGGWFWDMTQVQEQNITDNVVALIANRVNELEAETKAALMKAACLGNTFDLETLALIHDKTPAETAGDLWPALELNMLLPLRDECKIAALAPLNPEQEEENTRFLYKFGHDRIEEASYNLLPELERRALHLKIGRLLLEKNTSEEPGQLFAIVDHLNLGRSLMKTQEERDKTARLNRMAGLRAQASAAYPPALAYYKIGLELLAASGSNNPWRRDYHLTLSLTTQAAEAAMLARDFDDMDHLANEVQEWAGHILDTVKVYEIRVQAFMAQNDLWAAISTASQILKKLGVNLPKRPGMFRILLGLLLTKLRLAGKSAEHIINLPKMTDPTSLAASRLLEKAGIAAYVNVPELLPIIAFQQIKLSLRHGNAQETPSFYAGYGVILTGPLADVEGGYKYGKIALHLMEHLNIIDSRAKVMYIYNHLIRHWKEPLKETIPPLMEAYKLALETGDLDFAALALQSSSYNALASGKELGAMEKEISNRSETIAEMGQTAVQTLINIDLQAVRQLITYRAAPSVLSGAAYDEIIMFPIHQETRDMSGLIQGAFWKLILAYFFSEPPEVLLRLADELQTYLESLPGVPGLAVTFFFDSLARLSVYPSASKIQQKRLRKKVKVNLKRIKKWAKYAPMNQLHRLYLIQAEEARVLGNDEAARKLYEKSIDQARNNDHVNDEALAWELGGRFYLENKLPEFARFYLTNARYAYERWGCGARVSHLEMIYPEIFSSKSAPMETRSSVSTTGHKNAGSLDLSTIIKASQAISSEIVLDSLLHNMMRLLIENAGAEKGFFLLEKNGTLHLEAREEVNPEGGFLIERSIGEKQIIDESYLPLSLLDYTLRTGKVLVLTNAREEGDFTGSQYIRENPVVSILCVPVRKQGRVIGLIYMENNLASGAFTAAHVKVIEILAAQIDLSIENARLFANLEEKVKQRTEQLETALGDVNALKDQQDGDYFLTSILLKPLCENTATDKRIQSDILLKQYKSFQFEKWNAEVGGDMCACHDLILRGVTYTLFLNADAMGKSMQGAGGSLVLLAALKALLGKVNTSPLLQDQSPESWLRNAYAELSQIFATFKGFMQVTLIMGIADGENKRIFFLNAEHPYPVLYRKGNAEYFGGNETTGKLGELNPDPPLFIESLELEKGDIILMGSDGKDDLQKGVDEEGNRIISSHKDVFLECVREAQGEPEKIMISLSRRGDFIDDFSLLRLRAN